MLEPQADPLVAALAPTPDPAAAVEPAETDNEATLISARSPVVEPDEEDAGGGASMPVLVAVGLALSVLVFAAGGGLIYWLVSALAG